MNSTTNQQNGNQEIESIFDAAGIDPFCDILSTGRPETAAFASHLILGGRGGQTCLLESPCPSPFYAFDFCSNQMPLSTYLQQDVVVSVIQAITIQDINAGVNYATASQDCYNEDSLELVGRTNTPVSSDSGMSHAECASECDDDDYDIFIPINEDTVDVTFNGQNSSDMDEQPLDFEVYANNFVITHHLREWDAEDSEEPLFKRLRFDAFVFGFHPTTIILLLTLLKRTGFNIISFLLAGVFTAVPEELFKHYSPYWASLAVFALYEPLAYIYHYYDENDREGTAFLIFIRLLVAYLHFKWASYGLLGGIVLHACWNACAVAAELGLDANYQDGVWSRGAGALTDKKPKSEKKSTLPQKKDCDQCGKKIPFAYYKTHIDPTSPMCCKVIKEGAEQESTKLRSCGDKVATEGTGATVVNDVCLAKADSAVKDELAQYHKERPEQFEYDLLYKVWEQKWPKEVGPGDEQEWLLGLNFYSRQFLFIGACIVMCLFQGVASKLQFNYFIFVFSVALAMIWSYLWRIKWTSQPCPPPPPSCKLNPAVLALFVSNFNMKVTSTNFTTVRNLLNTMFDSHVSGLVKQMHNDKEAALLYRGLTRHNDDDMVWINSFLDAIAINSAGKTKYELGVQKTLRDANRIWGQVP